MRDILKMAIVLTLICTISGLALAFVHDITAEPIKITKLKKVQEPAIKAVFGDVEHDNDPIMDVIEIPMGTDKYGRPQHLNVFPAKKDGKTVAVAFETSAKGYGGHISIMIGLEPEDLKLTGISIVSMSETPGLGARIMEPEFAESFKGQTLDLTVDDIAAISGATISSSASVTAMHNAKAIFEKFKDLMLQ